MDVKGFVKTTLVGGFLFLIPLGVAIFVLGKVLDAAAKLAQPVAKLFPVERLVGVALEELVAILALLLLAFLAGLLAQTEFGTRMNERIEQLILRKMPGYTLLKSVARGATNIGGDSDLKVALANIDDAWLLSFIVEQHADGMLTVFVPSAPTPTAGNVYFMTEQQVRRIDVPVAAAVKCIMQLGVGSRRLLESSAAKR
jgi:uncharacterized membrane protein